MKLRDVKGLLPEKRDIVKKKIDADDYFCNAINKDYNELLTDLGNKEICIDVEKITQVIRWAKKQYTDIVLYPNESVAIAQAISQADIIKVKDVKSK